MSNLVKLCVIWLFITSPALAEHVPGTAVNLTPPDGYSAAQRFAGFMHEASGSSIMVSEIPGPYSEIIAGFKNSARMQAQGMELIKDSPIVVDDHSGTLFHLEQTAHGTLYKKWLVAVDRSGTTALIIGSYPEALEEQGKFLKTAVLSATFGKTSDPADALAFSVVPEPPFKRAKIIGQNLILAPDGQFPVKDDSAPFMVVALSYSDGLDIPDKGRFAEKRISKTATIEEISVENNSPIEIGGLPGYVTTAKGTRRKTDTPFTIYQVVLFDSTGYCLIQGLSPTALSDTYLPTFEKIAHSFRLKDSIQN